MVISWIILRYITISYVTQFDKFKLKYSSFFQFYSKLILLFSSHWIHLCIPRPEIESLQPKVLMCSPESYFTIFSSCFEVLWVVRWKYNSGKNIYHFCWPFIDLLMYTYYIFLLLKEFINENKLYLYFIIICVIHQNWQLSIFFRN